eukprot:TRINITY_DN5596_c0_g3_i1.p1 TRINITY_DN5596_c0_g3~~TRINITY_DN5596_c0_g3_i1.p1  ORF type:complete len:293 (+),score=24.99 TRINITY_DN5596_c0_g3_i1:104-880(+)
MAATTTRAIGAAVASSGLVGAERSSELIASSSSVSKTPVVLFQSARKPYQISRNARNTFRCTAAAGDNAAASTAAAEAPAPAAEDSSFLAELSSLVKLVDARDIVELELKHANYEILIRKKEAIPAPPAPPAPAVHAAPAFPSFQYAEAPPPPAPAAAAPAPAAAAPAAPAAPAPPAAAAIPPMVSPMAGTFYSSPAPGEPPFLKVGDTVTKGQVVCIVEAMKLMNEIEADQSGTVTAIIAEDGKPVAVGAPLFAIKP